MTDAEDARERDVDQLLFEPNASINGPIDEKAVTSFLDQIAAVRAGDQDLVLELNTVGGDADAARRIALEIRLFSERAGRAAHCVGKSYVYSAGVTILGVRYTEPVPDGGCVPPVATVGRGDPHELRLAGAHPSDVAVPATASPSSKQ
ncbi:hypothetical protein [Rhizobium redzepovicii]|uniref:hypothetical protein n=1 Tax=Rhizobium redzepovicii TaxID=2867518 RepID=UPI001C930772|nr:hypothetical protein [Rhizobium redzepovicii]MBY4593268.1 hypothetical protein [Rhizobium redzepovicii]